MAAREKKNSGNKHLGDNKELNKGIGVSEIKKEIGIPISSIKKENERQKILNKEDSGVVKRAVGKQKVKLLPRETDNIGKIGNPVAKKVNRVRSASLPGVSIKSSPSPNKVKRNFKSIKLIGGKSDPRNKIRSRSGPYVTRSDSPARVLRNGKRRKLASPSFEELAKPLEYIRRKRSLTVGASDKVNSESEGNACASPKLENGKINCVADDKKKMPILCSTEVRFEEISQESLGLNCTEGDQLSRDNNLGKSISSKIAALIKRGKVTEILQKFSAAREARVSQMSTTQSVEVSKENNDVNLFSGKNITDTNSNLCGMEPALNRNVSNNKTAVKKSSESDAKAVQSNTSDTKETEAHSVQEKVPNLGLNSDDTVKFDKVEDTSDPPTSSLESSSVVCNAGQLSSDVGNKALDKISSFNCDKRKSVKNSDQNTGARIKDGSSFDEELDSLVKCLDENDKLLNNTVPVSLDSGRGSSIIAADGSKGGKNSLVIESKEIEGKDVKTGEGAGDDADESGSHKRRSMRTSIPKTRAALLQCLTPRTRSPKSEGGQKQDLDSLCQMDEDNSMDGADERVSERISESCKTSGKKRKTCEDSPANVKPVKSVKVEVDSWAQHEEEMLRKAKLSALSDQSNCKKDAVSGLLIPKQENMEDTDWSVKVDDSELMSDLKKSMQTEIRRNSRNDSDIGSSALGVRVKVEVCDDDVGGSLNKGCDTPKLGKNNSTANDKLPKEVPCLGARKRNALKPEEKVKRRVLRRGQKEGKDIPNRITRKIAANIGVRRRRNPAATAVKKSIATTVRKGRAAAAKKDAASKTIAKGTAVSNGDEHSAAVKQGEQTPTQNMKRPGVEKKRDASASDAKKSLKKTVEAVDVSKLRGGLQGKKEESELKDASFEFSTKMKDHPPLVDSKNVPGEVATNTQQVTSEEHEVSKELNSNSVENTGEIPSVSAESLKEECPVVESMDVDDSVLSDKAVTTSPPDKKVISQDPALSCEKEGVNAVPSLAADNLKEIPEAPTVIATDFPSIEKCNPVLSSTAEPAEEDVKDVTSSGKKESVSSTSCTEETDNALQDAAMTKENTTITEVEVISSEGTACSNTETASTNEVVQKNSTSLPVKSEERTNNNTVEMSDTICSTVSEKMTVDPISLQEEEVSSVSSLTVEKAVNISSATNDEKKDILVSSLEKKEIMDVSDSEVNKNDNLCSANTEEVKDISPSLNDNKEEEVKDISASTVIKKDNIFSVNADKIKDILTSLAEAKDKVNETTDAVVEKANSICSITEKTNSICSVTATEKTNSICSVAAVEEKDSLICVVKEEEDAVSSVLASIVEKVNNICSSDTEGSKDIITCLVEKKNGEIKDTLMSVVEEPTNVCAITAAVKIETVPLLGDELMNVKKVNIPNKLVDEVKDTVESLVMSVEKVLIQHTVLSEENVVKECVELKEEEPISIDCSNTVKELKTESNQEAVEMPKILKPEEVNERIKDDKPATSLEKEDEKLVIPGACEVQSEEKVDVIAKLENGLGQLKSIDIDIEMSQIGDLSNDSNRCKTTSDSESTLEAENRSSTNDKLSEDSNTLDECEMLKGLDGIPLSVDGKNEDPLHVEDLKDLDTVGIREGGGLEEVSPEDQAIKESILSALGLQSRQSKSTVERKDTSYTGTLKTVIKLQRSPEKRGKSSLKMVFKHDKSIRDPSMPINGEAEYADDDDVEMGSKQRIEYRICKEADSLLDGGGDPTNFGVGNRKCLKPFTYRSYFELSTNSPFLTEHPAPAEENALDKDGGNKDDGKGSVKQVGSNLVIPEKSASFSIHPERLCSDVCSYCFGKFGSLDTPCHIAQLKNSERQKKILATETHLTADSCLCDACYRHVDRKANCPSYKVNRKRHHRSSSAFKSPCCVLGCSQLADHQVRRKWLLKLKRSIAKKVMIDMDKHPQHLPFPLCSKHYYWVDYFMVCGICKRRLTRNHMYPVGHEVHDLNSALSKDGIPVVLTEKLFLCKLCRYFSSLCLKYKDRSLLTANHKVFFDDYRRRILHYNDVETMDGEETSEPASLPPKTKRRRTKEKADSDPGETDGTADDMGDRTGATTPVMDYSHLDYPSTSSVKGPKLRLKIGNKSNGSDAVNGRSVSSPEGQDDMAMAANFVFHEPHSNGSTSPSKRKGDWEQCTASIQFSKETKKLFQELQRPYGNHSSFLRHLVLMEKYWRAGELMLSQTASSRASCYVNSVLNRLRAFDGVPSTRPATSTSSTFVPPLTPISSAGLSIVPVPVPASPTLPIIDLPLRRRSNVNNSPSSSNRIAISTGGMIVSARPMTLTSMSLTSGSSTATRTTSSSPATIFTTVPAVQQSGRKIIIDSKTVPLAGFTSKGKLAPNILQVTTGGGKSFSVVPSPAQLRQLQALKQQQQQLQQRQLVGPSTSSSSAIAAASTSSSSSSSSPSSSSSNFIPKICDVRSLAASDSSIRLWNKSELDVIPRPPKPQQQPVQPKLSVTILPKPSGSGIRSTTPVNIAPKPTTFVTPTGIILSRNPDISVSSIPVQRENTSSGC